MDKHISRFALDTMILCLSTLSLKETGVIDISLAGNNLRILIREECFDDVAEMLGATEFSYTARDYGTFKSFNYCGHNFVALVHEGRE